VPSFEKPQNVDQLLSEDHESLDKLLTELVAALDKRDARVAFAHLDLFWARLAMHIRGENLHLFPTILSALHGDTAKGETEIPSRTEVLEAISQLRSDHEFFMQELAGAIKVMRDRQTDVSSETNTTESVRRMIATLRKRLEAHNKLEEEMVYCWPAKLLEPEGQATLEVQISKELKNLPPRFGHQSSSQ